MLPSSVFPSQVEEEVGLLNKAAPHKGLRLDLDPDIIAALDDDFDFDNPENQLEDNFMEIANAEGLDDDSFEHDSYLDSDDFECSDDNSECSFEENKFNHNRKAFTSKSEGQKSRFTEYSHTSYNPNRNENLRFLDAKFDKVKFSIS